MLRACTICKILTDKKKCPVCKNEDLTEEWSGIIGCINPKKSKIAQNMKIEIPGLYAQHCISYD
ncbi:MAG: transcription elongation factor Spt4 [Candidatus Aenigmarchaeota archaeon ex4484_52]|nr:MAG: transcription elongation factor Spt4 [Candidatus Aenigmarchaeota archaeon ex4484_52]